MLTLNLKSAPKASLWFSEPHNKLGLNGFIFFFRLFLFFAQAAVFRQKGIEFEVFRAVERFWPSFVESFYDRIVAVEIWRWFVARIDIGPEFLNRAASARRPYLGLSGARTRASHK